MKNIRVFTIVLILTTLVFAGAFASPVSAKAVDSVAASLGRSLADSPAANSCFNSNYHAASDCDRQAPAPNAFLQAARLSPGACYSSAYHAASDCDRLAPAPQGIAQVAPLSLQTCFSSDHHAFSDCDRLAIAQRDSILANRVTPVTCFSTATHAASDCDRLMTSRQGSPQSFNQAVQVYFTASDGDRFLPNDGTPLAANSSQ